MVPVAVKEAVTAFPATEGCRRDDVTAFSGEWGVVSDSGGVQCGYSSSGNTLLTFHISFVVVSLGFVTLYSMFGDVGRGCHRPVNRYRTNPTTVLVDVSWFSCLLKVYMAEILRNPD